MVFNGSFFNFQSGIRSVVKEELLELLGSLIAKAVPVNGVEERTGDELRNGISVLVSIRVSYRELMRSAEPSASIGTYADEYLRFGVVGFEAIGKGLEDIVHLGEVGIEALAALKGSFGICVFVLVDNELETSAEIVDGNADSLQQLPEFVAGELADVVST